ncbi:MAG TPA: hypothetical protein DDZ19_06620 [Flavobacteriales bacterium]|jgi:hypothetical protein|nr:hypothetical protein [Flavobacteriales bacterium]
MKRPTGFRGFTLVLLAALLTQSRCNDPEQFIPYVPVDFSVNLNLPAYLNITVPSGHITVTGGSKGIILYRYTLDQFVALDRHATADIAAGCQVEVSEDGLILTDPCSNSEWLIIDGSVVSGDAIYPLHRYATQWNDPILTVFNP